MEIRGGNGMERKKWNRAVFILCMAAVLALAAWKIGKEPGMPEHGERNRADAPEEQGDPMKAFGEFLEREYREGKKQDLGNYVISRRLTVGEAAALAEGSPVLAYMKGYYADPSLIPQSGLCILSADINFDGLEDLVEYVPAGEKLSWYKREVGTANRLVIYLGEEGGGYRLSYSQMLFPTECDVRGTIEVLEYGNEAYLLFSGKYTPGSLNNSMTFYRLRDGIPCGKMDFTYRCRDMDVQVLWNTGVCDLTEWDGKWMDIYHGIDSYHCSCYAGSTEVRCGDAETEAGNGEDTALGVPACFAGDIDNDGMPEVYARWTGPETEYLPDKSTGGNGPELVLSHWGGSHGVRTRLFYYMGTSGGETDFRQMCGLDLWEGGLVPQWFWLKKTYTGNVTCVARQDKNGHEMRVDGYLIRYGTYKRVFSVRCVPEMECRTVYEYGGEGNTGFFFFLSEDGMLCMHMEGDGELQETVNRNIRDLFEGKMSGDDSAGGEFAYAEYWPAKVNGDVFYLDCAAVCSEENDAGEQRLWREEIWGLEINLLTGECREVERNECHAMNLRECLRW